MSYSYEFHEVAQNEYEASLQWYLERSEKAASGFIHAVDVALDKICTHPFRYRNTYKQFYEIGVNKYPFIVIYSIEQDNRIIVWRVFHNKRQPGKKFERS